MTDTLHCSEEPPKATAPNNGGPHPILTTGDGTTPDADEITKVVDPMLVEVEPCVPLWKDVVDVDGSKLMLERTVLMRLQYPKPFANVPPSNGLLLYGPSGCGKTTLVKSLVRESNCKMLVVTPSRLLSKRQGVSGKSVSCAVCCIAAYISAVSSKPSSKRQRQARLASSS